MRIVGLMIVGVTRHLIQSPIRIVGGEGRYLLSLTKIVGGERLRRIKIKELGGERYGTDYVESNGVGDCSG